MKKECQFILLPTEKISQIYIQHEKLCFEEYPVRSIYAGNQFLYILSDDKIKEGDKCYEQIYKRIVIIKSIKGNFVSVESEKQGLKHSNIDNLKKIIATTNPELKISKYSHESQDLMKVSVYKDEKLPSISQPDIEYIISLYNGKGKEVDVEKLANGKCNKIKWVDQRERLAYYNGIRHGYNQCLQNNADKKFTLKDIKNVVEIFKEGWENKLSPDLDKVIKSLKEQSSDTVIVEYEETTIFCDKSSKSYKWVSIPKLKDNQIIIHQT